MRLKQFGDIEIIRSPLIDGWVDAKTDEPIHAVQFETNGPIYMAPKHYDRLLAEITPKDSEDPKK